jgi:hypothetical protein
MLTQGLSLVGFISDQQQAHHHLLRACVPANMDPAALTTDWTAAQARRGAVIPFAGHPDIQPLPIALKRHAAEVLAQPIFRNEWLDATIQWVEIGPILAHQMTVDSNRSTSHGNRLSNPPTPNELMTCCLPLEPQQEQLQVFAAQNVLLFKGRSLKVKNVHNPHVHVVMFNARAYLFNGYHRAVGLMQRGVTHMPCIVRNVVDHNAIGIRPPDTFSAALLDANDPPTIAHFALGRALRVFLRVHSRILNVSWVEHVAKTREIDRQ